MLQAYIILPITSFSIYKKDSRGLCPQIPTGASHLDPTAGLSSGVQRSPTSDSEVADRYNLCRLICIILFAQSK